VGGSVSLGPEESAEAGPEEEEEEEEEGQGRRRPGLVEEDVRRGWQASSWAGVARDSEEPTMQEKEQRPQPDDETRPALEGDLRIEHRSASQAALQAFGNVETGAEVTLGGLMAKDLYAKAKDAFGSKGDDSKSNDSNDSKD
jgi:hypothetical protein